jgi:outer membrane protein TolC
MPQSLQWRAALCVALVVPGAAVAQRGDTLRLSIGDAVRRAEVQGDAARLASAQLEITDAQLDLARATAFPSLRVTGGYVRSFRSARAQAVGRLFGQVNTYTVAGTFTQPVFQGGRAIYGIRAASRLRGAARLVAEDARVAAALDAQRAYLTVLLAGRLSEIQQSNLTLASERVTQAERLLAGGRVARYDVLRARVERANVEPLALDAENARAVALLDLKRLLGIPLDQPLELTSRLDAGGVIASLASFSPDSIQGMSAASARLSVRAAELTANARREGVRVARADLLPTVSVFVSGGAQAFPEEGFPPLAGRVPCATRAADGSCATRALQNGGFFPDLSGGIQLSWNLFDYFRTKGNIDLAQAQAALARIQYETERDAAAVEIERAKAELLRARSFYAARQQAAQESQETFRLASLRYNRGLGTQLDVSDAQIAQLTAETNEARAAVDLYLAAAELAYTLGRPLPLPPSVADPVRSTSNTARDANAP